jgi:hypothetical protein
MKTADEIAKLRRLQAKADRMRNKFGINPPNAVLYQAFLDYGSEELVVVEADGFGGATACVVEGNYPLEYNVKNARKFRREQAAVSAATKIVEEAVEPEVVLS